MLGQYFDKVELRLTIENGLHIRAEIDSASIQKKRERSTSPVLNFSFTAIKEVRFVAGLAVPRV